MRRETSKRSCFGCSESEEEIIQIIVTEWSATYLYTYTYLERLLKV